VTCTVYGNQTLCGRSRQQKKKPVTCTVVKRLGGGRQANTQIADIDGKRRVMKETSDPGTVANLRHEANIVRQLQNKGGWADLKEEPRVFCRFSAPWGPRRTPGALGRAPAQKTVQVAQNISSGDQ
jgi:hypothetical protein